MITRIDWKNCQSYWAANTMRIIFRTLLPFLLFYVFKGSSAQTVHDVFTYTNKSVETLECSFTSTNIVQWIEQQDDGKAIIVFLYDVSKGLAQKQTNDIKYDNFNLIEGTNGVNLVITNVDKGDGGRYQCNPITSPVVTFDVTVEVLPESISIHCTELNVCLPSAERKTVPQINCVCTATGLNSSALEIEWEGVETFTASNTTRVMNSIRSNITLPPPDGTASISCSLTGYRSQVSVRLRSSTYNFSPPECNLVHECPSDGTNVSLICICSKGSPKVNAYSFYNSQKSPIGTQRSSSKSVQVETNMREIFYCSGCNGVLHNQTVQHEFNCKQGSAWWIFIIIVISLLLVVAAIIFLVVKKPWRSKGRVDVESKGKPKDGGPETVPLYENTSVQDHLVPHDLEGKTGLNTEAQTEPTGSKGPPIMETPKATSKEDKDKGKTGLNTEAQTEPTGSKGPPIMETPKATSKEDKDKGKTGLNTEAQSEPTDSKGPPKAASKEDKDNNTKDEPRVHVPQAGDKDNSINSANHGEDERGTGDGKESVQNGKESANLESSVDPEYNTDTTPKESSVDPPNTGQENVPGTGGGVTAASLHVGTSTADVGTMPC